MIKRLFNPRITLDFLICHAFCDYPLLSNAPVNFIDGALPFVTLLILLYLSCSLHASLRVYFIIALDFIFLFLYAGRHPTSFSL